MDVRRRSTTSRGDHRGFHPSGLILARSTRHQSKGRIHCRRLAFSPTLSLSFLPGFKFVMEREVLSKHRKALILFGVFHLLHGGSPGQGDAVTRYERHYPGRTFVISNLGYYRTGDEPLANMNASGGVWPSLLRT